MSRRGLGSATALLILACAVGASLPAAEPPSLPPRLAQAFGFELPPTGARPDGWGALPPGTVFSDDRVVHAGSQSVRLERTADSEGSVTTVAMVLPMNFTGKTIELRGFLRTENVQGFVGLWMREDGDTPGLALENMSKQRLAGTTDWAAYSISLPVHSAARNLVLGVLLQGVGKAWADDLELTVDGKPIAQAPRKSASATREQSRPVREGSLPIQTLTPQQVSNLVLLGKVWGFLKYHHPAVTAGSREWDVDLFRVLPDLLRAPTSAAAQLSLVQWIDQLGEVPECAPCATLGKDLQLRPSLDWISDRKKLSEELSARLLNIYRNRVPGQQFYTALAPAGNASFEHESDYPTVNAQDADLRLLAVFRYWNIIEYWFPYRDIIGSDWDSVLSDAIPRVVLAQDAAAYRRELTAMIAAVHDSHANLWNGLDARPPTGECQMPVEVGFVEKRVVVLRTLSDEAAARLQPGDVVEAIDGAPVPRLVLQWKPYYAASNEARQMLDMGQYFTRGRCGSGALQLRRGTQSTVVSLARSVHLTLKGPVLTPHDLPGDTFRRLSPRVAYLKLSSLHVAEVNKYMRLASDADALIVDLRGYPAQFVLPELGGWFVDAPTKQARLSRPDLSNPGAFFWMPVLMLQPGATTFGGRVFVLVDATSISQAEFTALAFRAARRVRIVGSTTAGADGDASRFGLPGDLRTMISGIGVFHPDGKPTQRVGIVPDIVAEPTIAGIRDGRDEVLERALREIVGSGVKPDDLTRLYKVGSVLGSTP